MKKHTVKLGFIAAALMNLGGVLIFSRFFSNSIINQADPVVMSNFGLLMICIWGLVFLAAAFIESNVKWLAAAFTVEKLVYVVSWCRWLLNNDLTSVYEKDLFAGIFYSIYGVNDLIFMIFFAMIFFSQREATHTKN
ncbi:hypothetical protein L2747_01500 [Shewanella marinintestina]|uniref:hypothetical protein n=1 Tax=Shewanella marinintestina TaxID=190305 RepID=UPI00200D88C0|nr:hypothetical protein [Shewanella marinintestina]MCL1144686.1 hypothetical protein [Shewanella marinintestina]